MQPPIRPLWKKTWNPKWLPRNGCDGRLIAKILIMTIQVNLVLNPSEMWRRQHKFAWIVVIKIFAIIIAIYWSPPWISHFFHNGLLGGCILFLQLGCFWIRFHFFVGCKVGILPLIFVITCLFLSLYRKIIAVLHKCIMHTFYSKFIYFVLCQWLQVN